MRCTLGTAALLEVNNSPSDVPLTIGVVVQNGLVQLIRISLSHLG